MSEEQDLSARRARLTPAQRALLEKRLQRNNPVSGEEEGWTLTPRPDSGPAPVSYGQRRLWHFAASRPDALAYNVYYAIGLAGPLDFQLLARSVRAVVERHEALRTRFEESAAGELQALAGPELVPSSLPLVDLSGLDEAAVEAEGMRVVAELAAPSFDLRRGPLLRTALLRVAPERHSLMVAVHHIVIDGWSLALFTRDVVDAYGKLAEGGAPAGPAALQSADFAYWQLRRVREGALAEHLSWWRGHLAGAPVQGLAWPLQPGALEFGGRAALRIEPDLTQSLKTLAQREKVTLFIALLAAFKAMLQQWTGQTDIVVGTPIALRGRQETAEILGFLLNVLPLRTDLSGDPSFLDLLQRARTTFLGALAHRVPPIEWLAEELAPVQTPGATPWVRVLFNMPSGEAGHHDPLRVAGLEVLPLVTGEMGSEYDLTFYAREVAGGIRLDLGYNENMFAAGEAGRFLEAFAALLGEAAARPEQRLSELAGALLAPAGSEV